MTMSGLFITWMPARHARVIGVLAINHEVVAPRAHAVRRKIRAAGKNRIPAVELADSRRGEREGEHVSKTAAPAILAGQIRQFSKPFFVKTHTDLRCACIQQGSVCRYRDRFRDGAWTQLGVHDGDLVEKQIDRRPDILGETGDLRRQFIGA